MDDLESFTLLPLHLDPTSKAISASSNSRVLNEELKTLNELHKSLLTLESPIPPPPGFGKWRVPQRPTCSCNQILYPRSRHGFQATIVGAVRIGER
jgi:hypothetical protein